MVNFFSTLSFLAATATSASAAVASLDYGSLAGLSHEEVEIYTRGIDVVGAQPLPPPIKDKSSKLVFDAAHPYRSPHPGDQRGPCPGLNTLASHGYLPRNGIATPAQIITASQEGFNMDFDLASLVTYAAFLGNGNHLTNLLSIGGATKLTGPRPPPPALAGGLNVHGTFEGDASMTRSDDFLGNNHDLNITLFQQMLTTMDSFGTGNYNLPAAAEHRFNRIVDSIHRNPTFDLANPRFATAYAEAGFPLVFFSNLSTPDLSVGTSKANIRSFFVNQRFPDKFHRREGSFGLNNIGEVLDALQTPHPVFPGRNNGTHVDSYTPDPNWLGGETNLLCGLYSRLVNITVALYPNPRGRLRTELKKNLHTFAVLRTADGCTERFPYD